MMARGLVVFYGFPPADDTRAARENEETPLACYRLSGEGRKPAFSGASLDTGFRRYDMEASALAPLSAEETDRVLSLFR